MKDKILIKLVSSPSSKHRILSIAITKHLDKNDEVFTEEVVVTNPFSDVNYKYIPAFMLTIINDRLLVREPDKLYELQVRCQNNWIKLDGYGQNCRQ